MAIGGIASVGWTISFGGPRFVRETLLGQRASRRKQRSARPNTPGKNCRRRNWGADPAVTALTDSRGKLIKVQIEEKLRPGFAAPQGSVASGTVSSNPACSSSESVSAVDRRALPEEPRGFAALGACTGREKRRAGRNSAPLYPFSLTGIDAVPPRTTGQAAVNRGL
jgi:hypothetical protein